MIASRILTAALVLAWAGSATAAPAKRPVHRSAPVHRPAPVAEAAVPVALPDSPEVQQLRAAFQYAFPIYEMMRTRSLTVAKAQAFGLTGVNRLFPRKTLADAASRDVTTPNNDTLYASAWLDLKNGPVTLTVPDVPGRYNSAALMNLRTDNVAIVGTSSGGGGTYTIVGPAGGRAKGDTNKVIQLNTNDAWLLVRVYVAGPDDLEAAGAAIDGFTLAGGGAAEPTHTVPTPDPDPTLFFDVVQEALGRSGIEPPAVLTDTGYFGRIGPSPADDKRVAAALPALRAELKGGFAKVGTVTDGWSYPGPGIGNFGDDDAGRAAVALGGLAALPRQEAVYLSASANGSGAALTGAKAYTVHIPPHPPVGAFWSLTVYQVDKDGRLFFVANPLDRFAVRSGTKSLHYERDGSLDLFVQASRPGGERVVNWLPAPPGPFRLVWRAYLPRPELLDGSFRLPPVQATEVVP